MQPDLFDAPIVQIDRSPTIRVNVSVDPRERPRLSQQCQRILEMLQERPHSNIELVRVALKYNARISELRQAGYGIECFDHDYSTGIAWYRLKV